MVYSKTVKFIVKSLLQSSSALHCVGASAPGCLICYPQILTPLLCNIRVHMRQQKRKHHNLLNTTSSLSSKVSPDNITLTLTKFFCQRRKGKSFSDNAQVSWSFPQLHLFHHRSSHPNLFFCSTPISLS